MKPGDLVKSSGSSGSYMFKFPPTETMKDGQPNIFVKIFTAEELAIVISTQAQGSKDYYSVQLLDSSGGVGWVYFSDLTGVTR